MKQTTWTLETWRMKSGIPCKHTRKAMHALRYLAMYPLQNVAVYAMQSYRNNSRRTQIISTDFSVMKYRYYALRFQVSSRSAPPNRPKQEQTEKTTISKTPQRKNARSAPFGK